MTNKQGRPFAGPAGRAVNRALAEACGFWLEAEPEVIREAALELANRELAEQRELQFARPAFPGLLRPRPRNHDDVTS